MGVLQKIFSYTVIPIFLGLILGSCIMFLWLDGAPPARIVEGATQFYFILALPMALSVIWIDWRGCQQSPMIIMSLSAAIGWTIWFAIVISLMYMVGITSFASSAFVPTEPDLFIDLRTSIISWRLLVNSVIAIILTIILHRVLASIHQPARQ